MKNPAFLDPPASWGGEIFEPAVQEARKHYDEVIVGDLEDMHLDYTGRFDFVICGDILEHLKNPYRIVSGAYDWLKPGGHLPVCLPNVRYGAVLKDLFFLADGPTPPPVFWIKRTCDSSPAVGALKCRRPRASRLCTCK